MAEILSDPDLAARLLATMRSATAESVPEVDAAPRQPTRRPVARRAVVAVPVALECPACGHEVEHAGECGMCGAVFDGDGDVVDTRGW